MQNNLVDLLKAYAERRKQKIRHQTYTVRKIKAWSIKEARGVLERLIGQMDDSERRATLNVNGLVPAGNV